MTKCEKHCYITASKHCNECGKDMCAVCFGQDNRSDTCNACWDTMSNQVQPDDSNVEQETKEILDNAWQDFKATYAWNFEHDGYAPISFDEFLVKYYEYPRIPAPEAPSIYPY